MPLPMPKVKNVNALKTITSSSFIQTDKVLQRNQTLPVTHTMYFLSSFKNVEQKYKSVDSG